jgi:hypothetical protein
MCYDLAMQGSWQISRRLRGGILATAALTAPLLFAASASSQQDARSACTCRYFGQDYHLGETVCLRGPDGSRLARCSMLLNNTTWTPLKQECPTTRLLPGASGTPDGNTAKPSAG